MRSFRSLNLEPLATSVILEMMNVPGAGYQELEHTADWALFVWAPHLPDLFVQAALGMNALSQMRISEQGKVKRTISVSAIDTETLLVSFLEEILYFAEKEGLGFDQFAVEIEEHRLTGELLGAPIVSWKKEIKAVTFHNLAVQKNQNGYQTEIVFDV